MTDDTPRFIVRSAADICRENIPPRRRRGVEGKPTIELSSEPVATRGERLHDIWWRGHQWAVTAYGIECLDGTYHFEHKRLLEQLPEHSWPEHMAGKDWVDARSSPPPGSSPSYCTATAAKTAGRRSANASPSYPPSGGIIEPAEVCCGGS
jgi:hypothetical protein